MSKLEVRVKCLQAQLHQINRERRRDLRESPPSSDSTESEGSNQEGNPCGSSSESSKSLRRQVIRPRKVHNDFKKWTFLNLRAKKGKGKIKSWRKMKEKLKDKFLPSYYLYENYSRLHHLKQDS